MTQETKTEEKNIELSLDDWDDWSDEEKEEFYDLEKLEQEDIKERRKNKQLFFGLVCVFVSVLLLAIGGFFRFYPLASKIQGKWQYDLSATIHLNSEKEKWTMEIEKFQGVEGATLMYSGRWQGVGSNEYQGKDIVGSIVLEKSAFNQEVLEEFRKDSTTYKVRTDNKEQLIVEYQPKALKAMFGSKSPESYFRFILKDFDWNLKGQKLYYNNKFITDKPMEFERVTEGVF